MKCTPREGWVGYGKGREGGVVVGGCLFWVGFLFCILYLIFCMVCDVCLHLSSLLFLFVK